MRVMSADTPRESAGRGMENVFAGLIAIFAAVLSLNELVAGKFGEDELKYTNEKTSTYLWYQSKGIKEGIAEGQRDLLRALADAGAIARGAERSLASLADKLDEKVARYARERREILLGSKAVGPEQWAQEVNGSLGQVTGAKELEQLVVKLSEAGDRFDLATLFLQLSLVAGALGLLVNQLLVKRLFLAVLVGLGLAGATYSFLGYRIAA
jgi:hypothetical protein